MFHYDTPRTSSPEAVIPSNQFRNMPLNKFCTKKFFEIGFINPSTPDEEDVIIDNLLKSNSDKQDITHITFIDKRDLEGFLDCVANRSDDLEFPPRLMQDLKQFVDFLPNISEEDKDTTIEFEAYKMKYKLIHTMYQQYANAVIEKRRQSILSKELERLTEKKPITRVQTPKSGKSTKSDAKSAGKGGKKQEKNEKEDYTEEALWESDLIVDDDAKNQVSFYVFRGFSDIELIKNLLKISVNISFILKVSKGKVLEENITQFWSDYYSIRSYPLSDYLQNIAVLKYEIPNKSDRHSISDDSLSEVTNILKELIDLKRLHFNYIKNLKIINTRCTEFHSKFPVYERILDRYPMETITIPLLLNSMLQEVQMKLDKSLKTPSLNKPPPVKVTHRSNCPFDIKNILNPKERKQEEKEQNSLPFFKLYEKDFLYLNFRSYKLGIEYIHDNLNILKQQRPVKLAQESRYDDDLDHFCPHKHDAVVPTEHDPCFTDEQTEHLINLLYLKRKYVRGKPEGDALENEFTRNILTFDSNNHVRKMTPHYLDETWKTVSFEDNKYVSNPYEVFKPMVFHWSEVLKPDVLLQYLQWSEQEFLHCDFVLCHLTNSLIVRYHNNVNPFGVHTTVWKDYLRTPVGLADFCRFTLQDDYDWLNKNKVFEQITYLEESKMYEEHSAMYKYGDDANREYRHLLVPQIQYSNSDIRKYTTCPCIEENVCKIIDKCNTEGTTYPEIKANLELILKDLEEYNKVHDFSEICKEESESDYSFPAYSLGDAKFRIIGHTTDFVSLDKVRLTVDTSRFCHERFKMMIKIASQSGSMVIHAPQKRFSCHFLLFDETIVVFSKPETTVTRKEKSTIFGEESKSTVMDMTSGDLSHKSRRSSVSEAFPERLQGDGELRLKAMDYEHYKSLNIFPEIGARIIEPASEKLKRNIKKDAGLLKRLQREEICFKVTVKEKNRKNFVRSRNPEREVAMSGVVKRIINNPSLAKLCEMPKRKCVVKTTKTPPTNTSFDCTVMVPNGLCLKVLPTQLPSSVPVLNIKQSYHFNTAPVAVADEKYRILTHDGTVIIGKLDGCVHLLTSSGREIRFTNPVNVNHDHEEMFCKVKKELSADLVRKLFNRMMAEHQDPPASEYFISRRGHLNSKYAFIESCASLPEIENLPFSTITMITFEGEMITLKKKKLYKQNYSRQSTEVNFRTEEKRQTREDGFSAKLERDGSLLVEFPDKTSIKTVVHVSKEPVKVVNKDDMGWILITSTFLYEHPYYKPVFFDNTKNDIEIPINEYDCLYVNPDGGLLTMRNSTKIDIKTDYIKYTRDCKACGLQYKSSFFIEPLYKNKVKGEERFFIEVEDSYNKNFKVDFQGNCWVDPNYDATARNSKDCQHSLETDHQRVFLIKKNLDGMLLWHDKAISEVMRYYENDRNISHFVDERNNLIYQTITKGFHNYYNDRFFGLALKKQETEESNAYVTTRNFYSVFEMDQIFGLTSCLKMVFNEEVMREMAANLKALKYHLTSVKDPSESTIQEEETTEIPPSITLKQKCHEMRKKMAAVRRLMKKTVPNYFNSEYCTFVKEKNPENESNEGISVT